MDYVPVSLALTLYELLKDVCCYHRGDVLSLMLADHHKEATRCRECFKKYKYRVLLRSLVPNVAPVLPYVATPQTITSRYPSSRDQNIHHSARTSVLPPYKAMAYMIITAANAPARACNPRPRLSLIVLRADSGVSGIEAGGLVSDIDGSHYGILTCA